jgi:hypothetical protein
VPRGDLVAITADLPDRAGVRESDGLIQVRLKGAEAERLRHRYGQRPHGA